MACREGERVYPIVRRRDLGASGKWELYTEELGAGGREIAFLRGLGGTTRYWRGRVDPLTADRRLLLVDLLGFGRSPKPWIPYMVGRHLDALVGGLGDRGPMTLVGHSLGARLALAFAARLPGRVERLVLIALPHFGGPLKARAMVRQMTMPWRWLLRHRAWAAAGCVTVRRLLGPFLPLLQRDLPPEVVADGRTHHWHSFTSSLWEVLFGLDAREDADRLPPGLPVHLIHGDSDRTAPLDPVRRVAADRPDWTLEVLAGVEHHPLLRETGACLRAIARAA